MAVLIESSLRGTTAAVLINSDERDLCTQPVDGVDADFGGFPGDVHHGVTRASCVRVRRQYPIGTEIRNTRQISILAADDLDAIAAELGIASLLPEWVGANLLLQGIPTLTELPPSTRLSAPAAATALRPGDAMRYRAALLGPDRMRPSLYFVCRKARRCALG